jgi:predicted nucleotidyltransferase
MINTFITTPEQRIISLFTMNPGQSFYTRQISKTLGISLGTTHFALQALEGKNMLTSRLIGKTKLYDLVISMPVVQAFRILNIILILEPLFTPLHEISRQIILYGSYAQGNIGPQSDLDLLVVTESKKKTLDFIEGIKRKTGLDIRPLVMDQVEWMKLEKKSPEFFDELSHGILLWERSLGESRF